MPLRSRLASLWRNLFRRKQKEQELSEELDSYLELLVEQKINAGLPPGAARRAALLELGGREQVKEQVREIRLGYWLFCTGHLKTGASLAQAQAEMKTIAARWVQQYPQESSGRGVSVEYWHELAARGLRQSLVLLSLAVGFILLIACANLANLMLARGAARTKELTIRAALGASRGRLLRQMLTEALLLSVCGGGLGLLLAGASIELLLQLSPGLIQYGEANLDGRVLGFTLAVTLVTGWLTGLAPALQFGQPDLNSALKEGGRTSHDSAGWRRTRGAFVVLQVALSVTLLIGAGLLLKSFYKLLNVDPGFQPNNLLTFEYRLPRNKYKTDEAQWNFHRQVTERLKEVPGVESVALARGVSFTGNGGKANLVLPDRARPARGQEPRVQFNTVTANYFATMRIPLVRGRAFSEAGRHNIRFFAAGFVADGKIA